MVGFMNLPRLGQKPFVFIINAMMAGRGPKNNGPKMMAPKVMECDGLTG